MSLAWESKLPLFEQAHARRSDPRPSHEAARLVTNLGRTRDAILWIIKHFGPKTDERIIAAYREAPAEMGFKKATEQSIRTRRNELTKPPFNLVEACGTEKNSLGKQFDHLEITQMSELYEWFAQLTREHFAAAGVHTSANSGMDAVGNGGGDSATSPSVIQECEETVQRVMDAHNYAGSGMSKTQEEIPDDLGGYHDPADDPRFA